MAEKSKSKHVSPKLGRPKTLSPTLDARYQIRCSAKDMETWEAHAEKLGYVGVSAWLRHVANAAVKQPGK